MIRYATEFQEIFDSSFITTEFIRLYIFEALQMTHTCCTIIRAIIPPDVPVLRQTPKQMKSIREEDANLRDVLEDMVPKLCTKYQSSENGLSAFVDEILDPEIKSVLTRLQKEDEELYAAGTRELGVIMETPVRSPIAQNEDENCQPTQLGVRASARYSYQIF
ncbi:hypothetical protein Ptr902_08442 [Pyrenophora tritici-repentis]|nr:hypothetical protein L13192_04450 [Pyrenophora tritici-repentis]KAI2480261.1 hypothetical protein Ptr902_08442 [Pyrenophora tritici-repentis]